MSGWKTRLFALAVALLAVVEIIDPALIVNIVGAEYKGYVTLGIALTIAVLREVTKTPGALAKKD